MSVRLRLLLSTIVLIACAAVALCAAETLIPPAKAINHAGENAMVCGTVASTKYAATSRGQPTFLNLDKPYPDHIFTIVIWGENRAAFGQPEEKYQGKRVCVIGVIEAHGGKAQISVRRPSQITTKVTSDTPESRTAESRHLSDDEIRKILIRQSLARYSGSCPCPYNRDRAGRRCGRRSAYTRPGGASPLCYDSDVTDKMVATYRSTHR